MLWWAGQGCHWVKVMPGEGVTRCRCHRVRVMLGEDVTG